MRTIWTAVLIGLTTVCLLAGADKAQEAERQLRAAMNTELVDGNLKKAIEQYRKVAESGVPSVAAEALLRMAECYRKMGDSEARKVYERVVREHGNQPGPVATAKARLGSTGDVGQNRLVCSDCASADTAMSPDGHWIVFTDARSGGLAARDLTTGQVQRLTAPPAASRIRPVDAIRTAISPNGRQVAYLDTSQTPAVLRLVENKPGATPRTLVERQAIPLSWLRDGTEILCQFMTPADVSAGTDRRVSLGFVSVADGSVREIMRLGSNLVDMAVSPDGRYIAYGQGQGSPQHIALYVMRADGSAATPVVNTLGRNIHPLWSPDGKRLLFVSNRSGKNGLWSIAIEDGKAAGNSSEVIADLGDGLVTPLGVTPAGVFHYVFQQDGVEQLAIVPVDKIGRRLPGAEEHLVGTRPIWSPDGKYMLFSRRQPGFDRGQQRGAPHFTVVRNMVTGEEKTFPASLGELQITQSWFRDGRGILTRVTRNGVKGLYRLNVETHELSPFVEGFAFDTNSPVILSHDEKTLYFFDRGFRSRNLTTGEEATMFSDGGGRIVPVLSPDGTKWAISRRVAREQRRYFGIADANGGNMRELYSPPFDTLFEHVDWAPDMKTIFFHQVRPQDKDRITPLSAFFPNDIWPRQVMRLSADGGVPEYTGIEADGWMLGALAISPDGRRGAYSYVKPVSELRTIALGTLK